MADLYRRGREAGLAFGPAFRPLTRVCRRGDHALGCLELPPGADSPAMERFGTSASGSRPTSGERPPHGELERALAALHGAQAAVAYVSGHATNVWTIYQLFKKRDLVLHDSLAHNSIIQGGQISEATRLSFPHNDLDALDRLLADERRHFKRVLIVTEGLFSMSPRVTY